MDFKKAHIAEPARLSDRINQFLRLAIFKGELKPGDKLPTEERIASDFKVSKVTVREALRQMEAEGLIEKRRGIRGGSFVAEPNHAKIGELILTYMRWEAITPEHLAEFRMLLEPLLAALAARNRTDEDLAAIKENIEKYQSQYEAGKLDRTLATEFHRLVAEACHNPMISAVMAAVAEVFIDIFERVSMTLEDSRIDLDYCRRLYDSLVEQRADEARKLMVDHFQVLLEILSREQVGPSLHLGKTPERPGKGNQ
ncbi:MAG: FCD domain-containing protein [Desulfarculaceae bacterium]|jgi:GntR family transcriptional repressor for pyruvate dehydrogenase complex